MSGETLDLSSITVEDLLPYLSGGHNLGGSVMTKSFFEVINTYLKRGNRGNKPKSRKRDEQCADALKLFFKNWRISEDKGHKVVKRGTVEEYRLWRLGMGISEHTVAREIAIASRAIEWWNDAEETDFKNPFRKKQYSGRKPRGRTRIASDEEIELLLKSSEGLVKDLIEFYLETGMRAKEPLELPKDRIIGDMAVLSEGDHKGGYVDARYLSDRALAILNKYDGEYAFGEKVSYWWLRNQWRKLRKDCELEDLNIHDLRRTCGDRMRRLYGLEVAQAQLGHRSKSTTEAVYAPMSADFVRSALLGQNGSPCEGTLTRRASEDVPGGGFEPPTYALRMRGLLH